LTQSSEGELRSAVVRIAQTMDRAGFCPSKSGNVSVRLGDGLLVTPSGLPYAGMRPEDLVEISLEGEVRSGERKPSSEWPFHAAIYRARRDAEAIVHTHSPWRPRCPAPGRHPGLPLHDRVRGGADIRWRPLRDLRDAGTGRQRGPRRSTAARRPFWRTTASSRSGQPRWRLRDCGRGRKSRHPNIWRCSGAGLAPVHSGTPRRLARVGSKFAATASRLRAAGRRAGHCNVCPSHGS
jgi:hypothetical protein